MALITLINNTSENIRIAIFKKPYKAPTLRTVAWRVEPLPKSSDTKEIEMPSNYSVYVSYSTDPAKRDDPDGDIKTNQLTLDSPTAKFIVGEKAGEGQSSPTADLERVFDGLIENEVHIENNASFGVWGHVLLDGQDVYPPQVITPGRTLMEDITSQCYLAPVDEEINTGSVIKEGNFNASPLEVNEGDTITITGSKWQGYSLSK